MVDSFTLSIKSLAVDSFTVNKVLIVDSFTSPNTVLIVDSSTLTIKTLSQSMHQHQPVRHKALIQRHPRHCALLWSDVISDGGFVHFVNQKSGSGFVHLVNKVLIVDSSTLPNTVLIVDSSTLTTQF